MLAVHAGWFVVLFGDSGMTSKVEGGWTALAVLLLAGGVARNWRVHILRRAGS